GRVQPLADPRAGRPLRALAERREDRGRQFEGAGNRRRQRETLGQRQSGVQPAGRSAAQTVSDFAAEPRRRGVVQEYPHSPSGLAPPDLAYTSSLMRSPRTVRTILPLSGSPRTSDSANFAACSSVMLAGNGGS